MRDHTVLQLLWVSHPAVIKHQITNTSNRIIKLKIGGAVLSGHATFQTTGTGKTNSDSLMQPNNSAGNKNQAECSKDAERKPFQALVMCTHRLLLPLTFQYYINLKSVSFSHT